MEIPELSSVGNMKIHPEIQRALDSVELPEVREIIKRLAQYNLGICIPHMHLPEVDFGILPSDMVQVEEDCHVRWVPRSQVDAMPESVPVAWRWVDDGITSAAKCIQTCTPNSQRGHQRGHLAG